MQNILSKFRERWVAHGPQKSPLVFGGNPVPITYWVHIVPGRTGLWLG